MNSSPLARWLSLTLLLLGAACSSDDNNNPDPVDAGANPDMGVVDAGENPAAACADAISNLETQVAGMLPNFPVEDAPEMIDDGTGDVTASAYAGRYRDDLANHPGCVAVDTYDANSELLITDNEATVPAGAGIDLPGYDCAAKEYTQDAEDTTKPIVVLVHGNSSGVLTFEEYAVAARAGTTLANAAGFQFTVDAAAREMLASKLLGEGYRVIAFDAQVARVPFQTGYSADSDTGNPFANIDHGWAVPLLQSLLRALMTENPSRRFSIASHSLGTTVVRDALRRLWIENRDGVTGAINPFAQIQDLVLLSGANHGVASGETFCAAFPNLMRGTVTCEMGDRDAFVPTYFTRPLNGPQDLYVAPCADGDYAFGMRGQCGGNVVQYTTVTMEDLPDGSLQDEFVSEASSALNLDDCVDNRLITLADFDASGFFPTILPGFFANHFGTVRSDAGMAIILEVLAD